MKFSLSRWLKQQPAYLTIEQGRQRLVTGAINLARGTALAPGPYERMLLDEFVRGNLTIDQVLHFLEIREHE